VNKRMTNFSIRACKSSTVIIVETKREWAGLCCHCDEGSSFMPDRRSIPVYCATTHCCCRRNTKGLPFYLTVLGEWPGVIAGATYKPVEFVVIAVYP
jgi:hypothetical protein